jgi:predicted enzyme related to lactoylglutathione lyase
MTETHMDEQTPTIGNVLHPVRHLAEAWGSYRDVVGLPLRFQDGERSASFDGGGTTLALVAGEEDLTDGVVAVSLLAPDVQGAVRRMQAGGAQVLVPPTEGPHETRAVLRDLDGHVLVVHPRR